MLIDDYFDLSDDMRIGYLENFADLVVWAIAKDAYTSVPIYIGIAGARTALNSVRALINSKNTFSIHGDFRFSLQINEKNKMSVIASGHNHVLGMEMALLENDIVHDENSASRYIMLPKAMTEDMSSSRWNIEREIQARILKDPNMVYRIGDMANNIADIAILPHWYPYIAHTMRGGYGRLTTLNTENCTAIQVSLRPNEISRLIKNGLERNHIAFDEDSQPTIEDLVKEGVFN